MCVPNWHVPVMAAGMAGIVTGCDRCGVGLPRMPKIALKTRNSMYAEWQRVAIKACQSGRLLQNRVKGQAFGIEQQAFGPSKTLIKKTA